MMINVITGIIIFSLNLKVKINKYEEKKTTLEFHFSILMFKKWNLLMLYHYYSITQTHDGFKINRDIQQKIV